MSSKKTNKIKKYGLWGVIIIAAVLFFLFFKINPGKSNIVINFGNDRVRKFEGPVMSGMTVLKAFYAASVGGHFAFKYFIDQYGNVEITKIDDTANISQFGSWHFYLNKEPVDTEDLDKIQIKSGDLIEARYE